MGANETTIKDFLFCHTKQAQSLVTDSFIGVLFALEFLLSRSHSFLLLTRTTDPLPLLTDHRRFVPRPRGWPLRAPMISAAPSPASSYLRGLAACSSVHRHPALRAAWPLVRPHNRHFAKRAAWPSICPRRDSSRHQLHVRISHWFVRSADLTPNCRFICTADLFRAASRPRVCGLPPRAQFTDWLL